MLARANVRLPRNERAGLVPSRARPPSCRTRCPAAEDRWVISREQTRVNSHERRSALTDLRELAETTCGITVLVRRLATIGSSAFAVKAEDAAAILLAPIMYLREPIARVWIAHELCHALFDMDAGGVHVVVDFDGDRHVHEAERRARAFAAELLLPEAGLRKLVGPPTEVGGETAARNLVAMGRDHFGSTWQVAANHLCNLGFIAMNLRGWLERQPPPAMTRAWATSLPETGAPSVHVATLTCRAYDAGHLTDGEVRALLDLDVMAPLPWER